MRKIFLFMNVSLDGYIEAPGHDISWANHENEAFSLEQSQEVDAILLGHRTYELMKSYWPTPQAGQDQPQIAHFMNVNPKYVASHQAFEPGWSNVTVLNGDVVAAVRQLKQQPGKTIAIFGSSTLCASLIPAGLIDEVQLLVNPVVLGEGTSLFTGLPQKADFRLIDAQKFRSGAILLTYQPVKG